VADGIMDWLTAQLRGHGMLEAVRGFSSNCLFGSSLHLFEPAQLNVSRMFPKPVLSTTPIDYDFDGGIVRATW
jgi:hypothetical protein